MIVLDASVLIAHLDATDAHHARAKRLLADTGAEPLAASPITIAETLVDPARSDRLPAARAALSKLGVEELSLGDDAAAHLAELRAGTRRKLPDCCVLLAARENDAALASFDADLVEAARGLGLRALD